MNSQPLYGVSTISTPVPSGRNLKHERNCLGLVSCEEAVGQGDTSWSDSRATLDPTWRPSPPSNVPHASALSTLSPSSAFSVTTYPTCHRFYAGPRPRLNADKSYVEVTLRSTQPVELADPCLCGHVSSLSVRFLPPGQREHRATVGFPEKMR